MKYTAGQGDFGPLHAVAKGSTEAVCESAATPLRLRKNQRWLNDSYPADLCLACRSAIDGNLRRARLDERVGRVDTSSIIVAIGMSANMADSPLFDGHGAQLKRLHDLNLNARIDELLVSSDDELRELARIGRALYASANTADEGRQN